MSTAVQTKFVRRVRGEMATQTLSIRGLARRIDPQNIDRVRRNLHRWLDEGITPSRASRADVAQALGISEEELNGDDDEESDPVVDLVNAIRRIAREERWSIA